MPIKLEFSASVCFIHKESVTMHGHTIVKLPVPGPLCPTQISHGLPSEWTTPGTSYVASLTYSDLIILWK